MKIASAFNDVREDEYTAAVEASEIGAKLIDSVGEHAHLRDATVGYIFRDDEIMQGGRVVAASAHICQRLASNARWNRLLRWTIRGIVGFAPDFLILIDRNIWEGLDADQKRALIDHELSHCAQARDDDGGPKFNQQTGQPIWMLKAHDHEEFCGVIERNGVWNEDSVAMAGVMIDSLSAQKKTA